MYDMTDPLRGRSQCAATRSIIRCATILLSSAPLAAYAQAGPPYFSNDPGTPGNGNWEINLAILPTIFRHGSSDQVPQIDTNFGVGNQIQLTYEVSELRSTTGGEPSHSGWGND